MKEINESQAKEIYRTLRKHLNQNEEGKKLIEEFESNPEESHSLLSNYLRNNLLENEELVKELDKKYVGGDGDHFTTLVTGGHVEQIVNIAKLGALNLTVKKQFALFRDLKQLLVTIFIFLVLIAGSGYGIYRTNQPYRMDNDFNIAVAKVISENPKNTGAALDITGTISEYLYSKFYGPEYGENDNYFIDVQYEKIPELSEGEAQKFLEKINADLLIFGRLKIMNDQAALSPMFCVSEDFAADANQLIIDGCHKFQILDNFPVGEILDEDSNVSIALSSQLTLVGKFVQALAWLKLKEYQFAKHAIDEAIQVAENYTDHEGNKIELEDIEGIEVLYLFASIIASANDEENLALQHIEKALDINENYGRGYIGKGNIYYSSVDYDDDKFDEYFGIALENYNFAKDLDDQTPGANVYERACFSIGNVNHYLYHTYLYKVSIGEIEVDEVYSNMILNDALSNYNLVIKAFENKGEDLQSLATKAYYGLGSIHELNRDYLEAKDSYEKGLSISKEDEMTTMLTDALNRIKNLP